METGARLGRSHTLYFAFGSATDLPGALTIPDQIAANKFPYYDALEAADAAYKEGRIDVGALEKLLGEKLAAQLVQVHQEATGEER